MGSLNEIHSVSNKDGASATVGVDIRKAADYSYSYSLVPGEGIRWNVPSVQASESLDVRDADYVRAYAQASKGSNVQNSKVKAQDKIGIGVSTEITNGSLIGYSNQATASSVDLAASQSFESASGYKIQAMTGLYVLPRSSSPNSNGRGQISSAAGESEDSVATTASGTLTDFYGHVRRSSGLFEAEQNSHVEGTFSSTAKSDSASKTRTSNYGQEYDISMRAVKDASGPYATGALGYYVNILNADANRIQGAVDAAQAGDTINVAKGIYKENVFIDKSLIVNGAGADQTTVDGDHKGSVFTIGSQNPNVSVALSGITTRNGTGTPTDFYGSGYLRLAGGGIWNAARVNLNDDIVSNNTADFGGGILNYGTMIMNGGSIDHNTAEGYYDSNYNQYITGYGGGIINRNTMNLDDTSILFNDGGGIDNEGNMNLNEVSVSHNNGSGIRNSFSTVTMNESSVDHNLGDGFINFYNSNANLNGVSIDHNLGSGIGNTGSSLTMNGGSVSYNGAGIDNQIILTGPPGILNLNSVSIDHNLNSGIRNLGGSVTMDGGSIDHNTAHENGGGIYNSESGGTEINPGQVSLNGVSIDHNTADYGGGIYNGRFSAVTISNSSIDHNIAEGYSEYIQGVGKGGGIYNAQGEVNLNDVAISSNSAGQRDQNGNWVEDGYGGGIWNSGGYWFSPWDYNTYAIHGTVNLNNSIISNNDAGVGGGIYNGEITNVNLISGSIDHNTAQSHGGGICNDGNVNGNTALVHDNTPDDIYP